MKFNHLGIPTTEHFEGEIDLPQLHVTVSDHQDNPYGIQWMRYWEDAPVPDLVKTVPHVGFEVDDLDVAIARQDVLIEPNSPSPGVRVALIQVRGRPSSCWRSTIKSVRTCSQGPIRAVASYPRPGRM